MPDKGVPKPSHTENEYFTLEDAEKKRRMALQAKRQMAADEAKRLKDLHFMHCPRCGMEMHQIRYLQLDVDVCFACGGVFLGKGEIDVIAHPKQKGIMSAILNWFKEETQHPIK